MAVRGRTSGERGFYAELGQLKGELPKVQYESIRGKISQPDIDTLFNRVRDNPQLDEWEKIGARQGLAKIFGQQGGQVPTESELRLLNKVYGPEFTRTILGKRSLGQKIWEGVLQAQKAQLATQAMQYYQGVVQSINAQNAQFKQNLLLQSQKAESDLTQAKAGFENRITIAQYQAQQRLARVRTTPESLSYRVDKSGNLIATGNRGTVYPVEGFQGSFTTPGKKTGQNLLSGIDDLDELDYLRSYLGSGG